MVLSAMTKFEPNNKMLFVDAGCGDGRVMIVAGASELFCSVAGCDIMRNPTVVRRNSSTASTTRCRTGDVVSELEFSYAIRMSALALNLAFPKYDTGIAKFDIDTGGHPVAVFSFCQGWCQDDLRSLARWFVDAKGKVLCICGQKGGQRGVASSAMVRALWNPLLVGYVLKLELKCKQSGSGRDMAALFFVERDAQVLLPPIASSSISVNPAIAKRMHLMHDAQLAREGVAKEYQWAHTPAVSMFKNIKEEITKSCSRDILGIITEYYGNDPTNLVSGTLLTHHMGHLLNRLSVRRIIIQDRLDVIHDSLYSEMPHLDPRHGGISRTALEFKALQVHISY
jgi:hypothetical protein